MVFLWCCCMPWPGQDSSPEMWALNIVLNGTEAWYSLPGSCSCQSLPDWADWAWETKCFLCQSSVPVCLKYLARVPEPGDLQYLSVITPPSCQVIQPPGQWGCCALYSQSSPQSSYMQLRWGWGRDSVKECNISDLKLLKLFTSLDLNNRLLLSWWDH